MNIKDKCNKIYQSSNVLFGNIKLQAIENSRVLFVILGGFALMVLLYISLAVPHIDGSSPQNYQKSLAKLMSDIDDKQRRERVSIAISNLRALETFYQKFMIEGEAKQLRNGELKKPSGDGKWLPSKVFLEIVDGYNADDFLSRGRHDSQKLQDEIIAYENDKPMQAINNSKQNIRNISNEIVKMERAIGDINSLKKIKISNINYIKDKYGITRLMYRAENKTRFNIKDIEFNLKIVDKSNRSKKPLINENIWIVFPRTFSMGDTRQGVLSLESRFKEKWNDNYSKNRNFTTSFTPIAFTEIGGHKTTANQNGMRLAQLKKELQQEFDKLADLTTPKPKQTLREFLSYEPDI